jgi:hypothetical protein
VIQNQTLCRRSEHIEDPHSAFDSYSSELSTPPKSTLQVVACDVLDRENVFSVVSDITSALAGNKNRPFVGVVNVAGAAA